MCLNCKYCRWMECTFEEWQKDEIDRVDEYDETNCPNFVPYWVDERIPYETND